MNLPSAPVHRLTAILARIARRRSLVRGLGASACVLAAGALAEGAGTLVLHLVQGTPDQLRVLLILPAAAATGLSLGIVLALTLRKERSALEAAARTADHVLGLEDRMSTAREAASMTNPARFTGPCVIQALSEYDRRSPGKPVVSLGRPAIRAASALLLLLAALALLWTGAGEEKTGSAAAPPGAPPTGKDPAAEEAQAPKKASPHSGVPEQEGLNPSGATPESKPQGVGNKPDAGRPLGLPSEDKKGNFEKVYAQPLFSGRPVDRKALAPPEEKLGPGRVRTPPPPPAKISLRSFEKKAEASMRREAYSRRDQRLVASYFQSIQKRFEKE